MPILFIIYPVINVKSYLASWYHFALYLILSFPEFCTWAELFSNEITMKSEELTKWRESLPAHQKYNQSVSLFSSLFHGIDIL